MNDILQTEITRAMKILRQASSGVFTEACDWYRQYQEHLNAWPQYAACVNFGGDPRSALPYGAKFFDFEDSVRDDVVARMRLKLAHAKRVGMEVRDEDIRQAAFSDALAEAFTERFSGMDRRRRQVWEAFALVDEGAYRGMLRWDALERKREELELAEAGTRCG